MLEAQASAPPPGPSMTGISDLGIYSMAPLDTLANELSIFVWVDEAEDLVDDDDEYDGRIT